MDLCFPIKDVPLILHIRTIIVYLYVYYDSMDTKLTLKLSSEVINRAKQYAKRRQTSLSRLVESYLDAVSNEEGDLSETSPLIRSISGVISIPEEYDHRADRTSDLEQKHT